MIINANALHLPFASGIAQTCVTSPPYWGLRNYGIDNQLGLEKTPEEYVENMVRVFREVWRVLRDDGTLWLNLGDSYNSNASNQQGRTGSVGIVRPKFANDGMAGMGRNNKQIDTLKSKDLIGIPWRVAFALQADGWYLRQDIIWAKAVSGEIRSGSAMPESVRDRFCKSHEYLFLLSKSPHYYFDQYAVADSIDDNETHEYNNSYENKSLQFVQDREAGNGLQQKQSASGRSNLRLQELPFDNAKDLGSQVQQIRKGEGGPEEILLFGEGADSQKGLSSVLSDDRRTERALPTSGENSRERSEVQGQDASLLAERKGESDQSQEGQEIRFDAGREVLKAQDRDKAQTSDQIVGLHIDQGGMVGDQGTIQQSMRLLREEITTSGDGSRDTVEQGWEAHGEQYSSILQNLQREKEQQTATRRSVWLINPQPTKSAHFATFPEKLVVPCIMAGTSERGCCPKCGRAWERVVEYANNGTREAGNARAIAMGHSANGPTAMMRAGEARTAITTDWRPACTCDAGDPVPCIVLDPFTGSGTTGKVAINLGRRFIGTELSWKYISTIARKRMMTDVGML